MASKNKENLNMYLDSLYRISRIISPFYDFSFPSNITKRKDNTYDGSHYDSQTNAMITDRLNQKTNVGFGVRVDTMAKEEYFSSFRENLKKNYHKEIPLGVQF